MAKKLRSRNAFKALLAVLLYLISWSPACLMAQVKDSRGKKFYLMIPGKNKTTEATIYITSATNTSGSISGGFSQNFTVSANGVTKISLPAGIAGSAPIFVTASDEVSVYGVSSNGTLSDAYLGIPVDALGTEYVVPSYPTSSWGASQFDVVGTEDITLVKITATGYVPNHYIGYPYYLQFYGAGEFNETTALGGADDFTGTLISSSRPVAVFGGNEEAFVTEVYPGRKTNRLVEMVPPTYAWGRKIFTVPSKGFANGDTWRILASQDFTSVYINGIAIRSLDKGKFFDITLTSNSIIEANKPILACQYANGSEYPGPPGAPFSIIATPVEQYLTDYIIPTVGSYTSHYVNVMAPVAAVGNVTVDGQPVPASSFSLIGNSGYAGAQVQVDSGVHHLHGNLPFGATAYGLGAKTAYGYPAGQLYSDVAKVWKLELRKKFDTLNVSRQSCYEALVADNYVNGIPGITVMFTVKGKNANVAGYAVTDSLGVATFCYQGPLAGKDTVVATVGTAKDTKPMVWLGDSCHLSFNLYGDDAIGTANNGTVDVMVSSGTPPYTFLMNDRKIITSEAGAGFGGQAAGTYTVEVRDAAYCAGKAVVMVNRRITTDTANTNGFPKDTVFRANELDCKATIHWNEPGLGGFDFSLPAAYNDANSKLVFKGVYNNHWYYQSTGYYQWPKAKQLAEQKGGHLLTVNSWEENDFIRTNFKQVNNYGPWIGLYNTGKLGEFAWVTGEPFYISNWYPTEPSNGGVTDSIVEPYVHIWGYDPSNRWNDLTGQYYLPFIAEFEGPVISYKQLGGPSNGSTVPVGDYQICYQVFNRMTNRTDTACFTIKVECVPGGNAVQGDTTLIATAGSCTAPLKWRKPEAYWPAQIWLPNTSYALSNMLDFKALYNGHGYYLSGGGSNTWPQAVDYSKSVGGHLVSITDSAENAMIVKNFKTPGGYGPWIGFYNIGRDDYFIWITGESIAYTNWAPNEPNNQNAEHPWDIREPYVLLNNYDYAARWNDMPATYKTTFITEFDSPIFTYTQVSGPAWGTVVDTGTYTICYKVENTITKVAGICCFKIKVVCGNAPSIANTISLQAKAPNESSVLFKASVAPNPSVNSFKINIASQNTVQRVSVRVVDVSGKVIEARNNVLPNSTITLGDSYSRGIYFIQVTQGAKQEVIKVVKE